MEHISPALLKARITLTASEIKSLLATPKILIPSPGAGKTIYIHYAFFSYKFVETAYNVDEGGALLLYFGEYDSQFGANLTCAAAVLTAEVDKRANFEILGFQNGGADSVSDVENKAIYLRQIGGGEYTLGDGKAAVTIIYSIQEDVFA